MHVQCLKSRQKRRKIASEFNILYKRGLHLFGHQCVSPKYSGLLIGEAFVCPKSHLSPSAKQVWVQE